MSNLSLFRVFTDGREVLGTFSKRHQAVAAMTKYNKNLKPGWRPAWVGAGPDHWRNKPENANENVIPKRGNDFQWVYDIFKDEPKLNTIKPDEWLEWYTSRKEVAFA